MERAFVSLVDRDWALIAQSKVRHWRRVYEEKGAEWGLRTSADLREFVRRQHPDWPSPGDGALDLEGHTRLAELLARASENRR